MYIDDQVTPRACMASVYCMTVLSVTQVMFDGWIDGEELKRKLNNRKSLENLLLNDNLYHVMNM